MSRYFLSNSKRVQEQGRYSKATAQDTRVSVLRQWFPISGEYIRLIISVTSNEELDWGFVFVFNQNIRWNPRDFSGAWDQRTWLGDPSRTVFCSLCPPAAACWGRESAKGDWKGMLQPENKPAQVSNFWNGLFIYIFHQMQSQHVCLFGLLLGQRNRPAYLTVTV